ncbi:restriction endonuclease subunit S [Plantibacter cousiniae (nom. nud.)]|uniref:restriction endonuclease subunit S n=1 Tax=Plantibacter cousiniae (nom. nud.) TaxID=199709 RepID=UPI001D999F9A|nr:restriction endonuclease subunit S [Plantibacter cousiniae]CAH0168577.1 hypothetical protein SRABI02_01183 [Plantibacter cousiniae]
MNLDLKRSTWQRVAFGDVVRNVNETVRDAKARGIDRVIAMEHMDPAELGIQRWGDIADGTTFTRRVRPGQTLFGKRRAYQRKVAYATFDAICSGDIYTFEANETRMLGDFLPFIVQADPFFDHALGTSAGSLSPRTNWRDLAKFEFDLPPLDEQKRIADLLWAIGRHRAEVANFRVAVGESQGPLMTLEADSFITVEDVATTARSGATPPRSNPAFYGGDIPWLKSGEVTGDGIATTEERITEAGLAGSATWLAPAGAIVVAMYGDGKTRGQVGRIAVPMCTNQAVLALVPDDSRAHPDFLYYWLRSRQQELRAKGAGAAQKNLSKGLVVSEPFPEMSLETQAATAKRIEALDDAQTHAAREADHLLQVRAALMSHVFGGS